MTPAAFTLAVSAANPNPSIQLTWKVNLIDGKTVLDLTAASLTSFSSSDPACNFGAQKGLVFAASSGTCTITAQNNTLSATAVGTISAFTPREVSALAVPGSVAVDVSGAFAYIAAGANGLVVVDLGDRTSPRIRGTLAGIGNAVAVRAAGQNVLVADSAGFLRVLSVSNVDAPSLRSSLAITGSPAALAVRGNTVAVAAQAGGVVFVDITSPSAPTQISTIAPAGSAVGVDLDLQRALAAVALGTSGMQLIDISNLQAPQIRGTLAGGNVLRVLMRYPAVLLADYVRSVSATDITNPAQPGPPFSMAAVNGGLPVDIAAFGSTAITADGSFGAAVPVLNISDPLKPTLIANWTLGGVGFSSSIAMDNSFGYLIQPGTLRIYKYQNIVDSLGVAPTVTITAPVSSTPLIQGQNLTVLVTATDDIAVSSVNFLLNGQVIGTTASTPYQLGYTVPATATMLTFGATAVDFGNNVGTAANVQVQVIPDPLTSVSGRVLDTSGNPVVGATVSALSRSATTVAGGTFTLTGLPTIRGPIVVSAVATVAGILLGGVSAPLQPVLGGIIPAGDIRIVPKPFVTSVIPKSILAGVATTVTAGGSNFAGSTFTFVDKGAPTTISITSVVINAAGTSATMTVTPNPQATGRFTLVAANPAGSSDSVAVLGFVKGSSSYNTISIPGAGPTADPDGDTATNSEEATAGADPLNPDTDADNYPDGLEIALISDPLDPAKIPSFPKQFTFAALTFSLLNANNPAGPITPVQQQPNVTFSLLNSINPGSTQPLLQLPTFTFSLFNGLSSSGISPVLVSEAEVADLSALTRIRGSHQAVLEAMKLRRLQVFSAVGPDSDGDGLADGVEFTLKGDFLSANAGDDDDFDGLPNGEEVRFGTDPANPDSDNDGISDGDEKQRFHTDPLKSDTDGDGYGDGEELVAGTDPVEPKSHPDYPVQGKKIVVGPSFSIENGKTSGPTSGRKQ